jgi:hypothetical protein
VTDERAAAAVEIDVGAALDRELAGTRPDSRRRPRIPIRECGISDHGHRATMRPLIRKEVDDRLMIERGRSLGPNRMAVPPPAVRTVRKRQPTDGELQN